MITALLEAITKEKKIFPKWSNAQCTNFTQVTPEEGAVLFSEPPHKNYPQVMTETYSSSCKQWDDKGKTVPQKELCPWAEQLSKLISNDEAASYRVCLQNRLMH